jgi:LysR family nitrogen assimilation transcriptional regulator
MDLRQLRYFLRVAETGSFTAAAVLLHVSQPALGMQIRRLEEEFGTALLVRHARGATPTEAGRLLARHAAAILDRIETARSAMAELAGGPRGTVALGVTPTVGRVLVPELLERFAATLPGLTVTVSEALSEEVMRAVADERLDLAFTYNPQALRGLACAPLLQESLRLVGPAALAPRGRTVGFAAAARHALILPSRPHGIRVLLEEAASAHGLVLDVRHEIDSIPMQREMVERGLGCTVLPWGVVAREVETGRLFARPIVRPRLQRTLYLARPARRPETPAVAAARGLIETAVAEATAAGRWGWHAPE